MGLRLSGTRVYMVVRNDDLTTESDFIPNFAMRFGPKRRTIRWRGRRFNVPTVRVVEVGAVTDLQIEVTDQT